MGLEKNYINEKHRNWYKKYQSSKRMNTAKSVPKNTQIIIGPGIKTHPLVDIPTYDALAPKSAFDFFLDPSNVLVFIRVERRIFPPPNHPNITYPKPS